MRTDISIFTLFILGACLLGQTPASAAEDFVVIVNDKNPVEQLSREDISRYFLKHQTRWPQGGSVRPIDQRIGDLRSVFSEEIHGRSMMAVKAEWTKRLFSGRATPPVQRDGDIAVIEYVQKNIGGIGYVSAEADLSDVKVIQVTAGPDDEIE